MRRIDITLDEVSEQRLDQLIKARHYQNRSEAIRAAIELLWRSTFNGDSRMPDKLLESVRKDLVAALASIEGEMNWRADHESD